MEIVVVLVIIFIAYGLLQNWASEQPQKAMEKITDYVFRSEQRFKESLADVLDDIEKSSEIMIKMRGQKEYNRRVGEISEVGLKQEKISGLNIHLQEKFKFDIKQTAMVLQDYAAWLNAQESILSNRISMKYLEDLQPVFEENRENEIKSETIEKDLLQKLIKQC